MMQRAHASDRKHPAKAGTDNRSGAHQAPVGNQALQQHLKNGTIRAKTIVGGTGDPQEAEADRIADDIMSGGKAAPCACGGTCDSCSGAAKLRRKVQGDGGSAPARADAFGASHGRALDGATRNFFETRFGEDFSGVRIHDADRSHDAARTLSARAFTAGSDIGFAEGEFDPYSGTGRKLLAHELAHVVQNRSASSPQILRRQDDPKAATGGKNKAQITVVSLSSSEFESLTGQTTATLPEKKFVSIGELTGPGAGMGGIIGPKPMLPVPVGSTGFMWEGAHVTDFAAVPQTDPLMSFLFGEGTLSTRGFRAPLWRHSLAKLGFRGVKDSLYFGTEGSYANDFLFPYSPGSKAAYKTGSPSDALDFAADMDAAVPGMEGETYRFSTPRNPKTLARLLARWRAAGVTPCPPGANNCATLPADLHAKGVGTDPVIQRPTGEVIDPFTGTIPGTDTPGIVRPGVKGEGTPMYPGEADTMTEFFGQPESVFSGMGLGKTSMSGAMLLRGATGIVRAGGTVLVIYNAVQTTERIADAPSGELPVVLSEEAGSWGGGAIGAILGEALGTVVVCTGTGPGVALCVAAFGIAGGALGSSVGKDYMHDVGEGIKTMTLPKAMDAAVLLMGTKEQKQMYGDMRNGEGGGSEPSIWDLFGKF